MSPQYNKRREPSTKQQSRQADFVIRGDVVVKFSFESSERWEITRHFKCQCNLYKKRLYITEPPKIGSTAPSVQSENTSVFNSSTVHTAASVPFPRVRTQFAQTGQSLSALLKAAFAEHC